MDSSFANAILSHKMAGCFSRMEKKTGKLKQVISPEQGMENIKVPCIDVKPLLKSMAIGLFVYSSGQRLT